MLGLNLLCLLSQNRVAEFHTVSIRSGTLVIFIIQILHFTIYFQELELLPPKEIQSNIYINHPVSLEQFLMEGSYNKVFVSKDQVPSDYYKFFIYKLLNTIRTEIAACLEKSYEKISIPEATRLLFFKNPQELQQFAKSQWQISNNWLVFNTGKEVPQSSQKIPSEQLALQTIEYARELEMIV